MNNRKITAIMPIKLNNERFPGKNTRMLGKLPLLQYQLIILNSISEINQIYVYCSDEQIKKYLMEGVKFLKRPKELDLPISNFTQIFECFKNEVDSDIYVYAHATAPFISVDTIKRCIDAVKSGEYDSAFCAQKLQDFIWNEGKPLNFNVENLPRSQDLPMYYRETSGVYVFTKEVFEKYNYRIGKKPFVAELGYKEAIDINTSDDFELAEFFLNFKER